MDVETLSAINFFLADAKRVYNISNDGNVIVQRGMWFREWPNFCKDEKYREIASSIYSYIMKKTSSPDGYRFHLDNDFVFKAREEIFGIPLPEKEPPTRRNEKVYS